MEVVSSTTSATPSPPGNCQVCFQEGHGFHFGALTCRACAAFFRRCHFSPKNEARCIKYNGKCQPKSGRWFCKKCRLDRCLELGMTTDNIQYHRDSFASSLSFAKNKSIMNRLKDRVSVPITVEAVLGTPHIGAFLRKNTPEYGEIPYVDVSHIIKKALENLYNPDPSERKGRKLSDLEKLSLGLEEHQSWQSEHVNQLSVLSRYDQMNDWDRNMCAAAKWLACSDKIRKLDENAKLSILQSIWQIWGRLERIGMTAKMRVNRQCGKRQFVISNDTLIDYDSMKADMSWGSPYSFEELNYFLKPTEMFYDEIIRDIIDFKPDSVEFSFLLLIICLKIAENRADMNLEMSIDSLYDTFANDLHNYYIRQNRAMYAVRLKQLMKIKEHFLISWQKRREKYDVGTILNFFCMEFSSQDYFHVNC